MILPELSEDEKLEIGNLDFGVLDILKSKEDEWLEKRKGKFTASEFVRLMGYEDKETFPDGAITYVTEKVLEIVTINEKRQLSTDSVEWGKETEIEAVEKFSDKYGFEVDFFGNNQQYVELTEDVGCTPDGLIEKDFGVETKCPDSKTHLYYLENLTLENFKKECTKYYWQMQGSMYITGRKAWFFISYDPRFKKEEKRLFVLRIERNNIDIAKLEKRLTEAIKRKRERLKAFE
ncbi:lambda exonuclease family protein [Flavobacterium sp.]